MKRPVPRFRVDWAFRLPGTCCTNTSCATTRGWSPCYRKHGQEPPRPRTLQVQHHHCTYQRYVRGLNPAGDGRQPPDHKAPPPELLSPRVRSSLWARELLS